MARADTFPNGSSFSLFIEDNCPGCIYDSDPDDTTPFRCNLRNDLEMEQYGFLTPRRAAYIDRTIVKGQCLKRKTSKAQIKRHGQRVAAGQLSIEEASYEQRS